MAPNQTSRWSTGLVLMVIVTLFGYLLWGEQGWFDLAKERREYETLRDLTTSTAQKNELLRHQIERLQNDWVYIEGIARNELGMVGKDEIILQMNRPYRSETKVAP